MIYFTHLYFHRVADHDPHYTCMPPRDFIRLLDKILEARKITSVAQALADVMLPVPALERPVIFSFDDGHADLLDFAVPAMAERGVSATLFIPTDHIGGKMTWRSDGTSPPLLSAADLRTLAASGFDIQCHGGSHVALPGLSDSELEREMVSSANRLADLVGQPVRSFAYPYGIYDDRCRKIARQRFDVAFSTVKSPEIDWSANRFALRRTYVARETIERHVGEDAERDLASSQSPVGA